ANNPLTDEYIIKHRGRVMSRRQVPKGKRGGRALVDALKEGRSLAMLVDQKLNSGISVPFMGLPAMTAPAAARLSLKYGAPLIQISLVRLQGAHLRFTVHDPLDFAPTGDAGADTEALTIRINEALEADIRAHPGQWLWFHRRWPKEDA
ncbi:MAG: lysophospholipid acyltransferase family protein, partial [Oricola sp.]|nr:lysophospholipid acyltransferase family protein [Oricola sp.]